LPALFDAFRHSSSPWIVDTLGRIGDRGLDGLIYMLSDRDPDIRSRSAAAIKLVMTKQSHPDLNTRAVRSLSWLLFYDGNSMARVEAARALAAAPPTALNRQVLAYAALNDQAAEVRSAAALSLARLCERDGFFEKDMMEVLGYVIQNDTDQN